MSKIRIFIAILCFFFGGCVFNIAYEFLPVSEIFNQVILFVGSLLLILSGVEWFRGRPTRQDY